MRSTTGKGVESREGDRRAKGLGARDGTSWSSWTNMVLVVGALCGWVRDSSTQEELTQPKFHATRLCKVERSGFTFAMINLASSRGVTTSLPASLRLPLSK